MKKRGLPGILLRFVLVFAVVTAGLAALWPRVAPPVASAVTALARPVFRLVEEPNLTVLDVQGDTLGVYRIVGEGRIAPVVVFDRYLYFAVVPLLALFAATPGLGLRRRATRAAIAVACLIFIQVGYLVASVELLYAVGAGRAVGEWPVAVRTLWEFAPILLWATLTAGAWMRVLRSLRTEGTQQAQSSTAGPIGAEGRGR
jgi:hypothetical protein